MHCHCKRKKVPPEEANPGEGLACEALVVLTPKISSLLAATDPTNPLQNNPCGPFFSRPPRMYIPTWSRLCYRLPNLDYAALYGVGCLRKVYSVQRARARYFLLITIRSTTTCRRDYSCMYVRSMCIHKYKILGGVLVVTISLQATLPFSITCFTQRIASCK